MLREFFRALPLRAVNERRFASRALLPPVLKGFYYVFVEIYGADLPELVNNLRGKSIEI
tara:strand:+ start:239 stop:415 length:177 start_codon:yes stop_codon:yes gene_type:complete